MKYGLLLLLPLMLLAGCRDKDDPPDYAPVSGAVGLMPLAVGNWWEYEVTASSGADTVYSFRRMVKSQRMFGEADYYVVVDSQYTTSVVDTFGYFRNTAGTGVMQTLSLADTAQVDTLFLFPNIVPTTRWRFGADSVVALSDAEGYTWDGLGDSTNTVVAYQRWQTGGGSFQYLLAADSLGLLSAVYAGTDPFRYHLTAFHVIR